MVDAKALVNDLSRQVQANDIESGKITLTKLKVGWFSHIILAPLHFCLCEISHQILIEMIQH